MAAPLLVIVGPTASGKSGLALEIAKRYNGEIIAADSRTVYAGMDIGTAKPSTEEQMAIPHHLLDVVKPDEHFTAASFKVQALRAVDGIHTRGHLPVMVGGTGLYIDGVIFDFAFLPPGSTDDRDFLQSLSVDELQQKLLRRGIPMPENARNPRHLIRALETNGAVPVKGALRENTLIIGIEISKADVIQRIETRVREMYDHGLRTEVEGLAKRYGWEAPGMSAVGYKEWQLAESDQAALDAIVAHTVQYAKRQRTWFKRNPHIRWVQTSGEALQLVKSFLQK